MTPWIFGYGSLVWRPDMPVSQARRATLSGFVRRFWQGSPDHRGTHEAPGRVVTLVPDPKGVVVGRAYRIASAALPEVLGRLDHREKAGYERRICPVHTDEGPVDALVYFAAEGNPSWLGPAPVAEMAAHIARSVGPSGTNRAYLLELARALGELNADDRHVADLAAAVRAVGAVGPARTVGSP